MSAALAEALCKAVAAMEHAAEWYATGHGRPPSQTCLFEIEEARAVLAAHDAQPAQEPRAFEYEEAIYGESDVRGRGWARKLAWTQPGARWMTRNVQPLYPAPGPDRAPLTEERIASIVREASRGGATRRDGTTSLRIVRAVELAHGIGAKP